MRSTPIPLRVANTVRERAAGHCERCGMYGPTQLHHRIFRSRGELHTVSNIISLCGMGNVSLCHGFAHSEGIQATAQGFAIRANLDPLTIPYLTTDLRWFTHDDNGNRAPVVAADAVEHMTLLGCIRTGKGFAY